MPLPEDVLAEVPEAYRDSPALKEINTVGDLAKTYVETKAMVGNSLGRMPDTDAGPEAMQTWANSLIEKTNGKLMMKPDFEQETQTEEFYRTIGKPKTIEEYESPEGSKLDAGTDAQLRELGHKNNLTKAQLKGLMTDLSGLAEATGVNVAKFKEDAMAELKDEWGMATDERIASARKVYEEYPGLEGSFDDLTPAAIKALHKINTSLTGKGAQVNGQKGADPDGHRTPEQAMEYYYSVLKRVSDNKEDLSHDEKIRLTKLAMDVAVKEGGMDGSINSLRAGRA
jgi:hypothetical protein